MPGDTGTGGAGVDLKVLLLLSIVAARARDEAVRALEAEAEELRRRRAEDGKANEKVVAIFAAHEQRWLAEKKSLKIQLRVLAAELRAAKKRREDALADVQRREAALEEAAGRTKELEAELQAAAADAAEAKEAARKAAEEHAAELWMHKTAFAQLASNQRQVEAAVARAAREAEEASAARAAAVAVVEELSAEELRLRAEAEQKDRVLSALLRKAKIDMEDKRALAKEAAACRARKKQAELELERWRKMWHTRRRRSSLPHDLDGDDGGYSRCNDSKIMDADEGAAVAVKRTEMELQEDEIEAFIEQLTAKGERLELLRWRIAGMDVESAKLRWRVEELERELSHCRDRNAVQEAALLESRRAVGSLEERLRALNAAGEQDQEEEEVLKRVVGRVSPERTSPARDGGEMKGRKMDMQALAVACKIKQVKQHSAVLHKLIAGDDDTPRRSYAAPLVSLLEKQVRRYESLEQKLDGLCRRIGDESPRTARRAAAASRALGGYLEETFQLQRYVVATGQKLPELQARIPRGGGDGDAGEEGTGVRRFGEVVVALVKEIQRGMELRVARIIGDLEGTLAADGILR